MSKQKGHGRKKQSAHRREEYHRPQAAPRNPRMDLVVGTYLQVSRVAAREGWAVKELDGTVTRGGR